MEIKTISSLKEFIKFNTREVVLPHEVVGRFNHPGQHKRFLTNKPIVVRYLHISIAESGVELTKGKIVLPAGTLIEHYVGLRYTIYEGDKPNDFNTIALLTPDSFSCLSTNLLTIYPGCELERKLGINRSGKSKYDKLVVDLFSNEDSYVEFTQEEIDTICTNHKNKLKGHFKRQKTYYEKQREEADRIVKDFEQRINILNTIIDHGNKN